MITNTESPQTSRLSTQLRPPLTRQSVVTRLLVGFFLIGTMWAWGRIDMSLTRIFGGIGDINNLLQYMLPPSFGSFRTAITLTFETLWMAVIGTFLAIVLSVPLALGAARNTTINAPVMFACRGFIAMTRAIPDLIFAAVFVRSVGIGVLPGVLALGMHSIGMIGKLLADSIEQSDPMVTEALKSTGASKRQVITTSIIPQVMPSFIGIALYRLDINLRSSTVLGLVGAGGVGFLLKKHLGQLEYDLALGVVIVVFVFISAMEFLSSLVRGTLIGGTATPGAKFSLFRRSSTPQKADSQLHFAQVSPKAESLTPPWTTDRTKKLTYGIIFLGLLLISFTQVNLSPGELFFAFDDIWRSANLLLPPDFSTAFNGIKNGMIESIAVAFVSTALGLLLSLPLGLFAARNIVARKSLAAIARFVMLFLRGTPDLIVAVIFVAAMGLGPVPGTFALVIGTAGFFGKLIADSIEEVDPMPREAVFATGATRVQEVFTSVIPQAMPALISNLLYVLDINLRSSAILGIVGGGGIGFLLFNSLRVLQFETTGAIIVTIFVVVYLIELLAGYVRKIIL